VTETATRSEAAGDPLDAARSDVELVSAVASGERSALAMLYDRHAAVVLAVVGRILGDRAEAEDLVHDVFVEIWQRAGQYDPGRASVRGWVLMVARSRALDRRRAAFRTRRGDPAGPVSDAAAPTSGDHGAADGARLDAALAVLPAAQQQVIRLAYFEGLSSSEMADRLGVPPGTVKSRVAAAFQKLRAYFEVAGDQGGPVG